MITRRTCPTKRCADHFGEGNPSLLITKYLALLMFPIDDERQVVAAVCPRHRERDRCLLCGRRTPGFDPGEGRSRC